MRDNPKPYEIYTHFKGEKYQVITLAEQEETGEIQVVYQAMYGEHKMYVRSLSSFLEETDQEKYPDADQKYRFLREGEKPVADQVYGGTGSVEKDGIHRGGTVEDRQSMETVSEEEENPDDFVIDPLVIEFLDSDSSEERLNILAALHHRITDDMINTMAIAVDVEVNDGELENRYRELKNCIVTKERYECNRLR